MESDNLVKNKPKNPKGKILSLVLGVIGLFLVISIMGVGALLASHTWNPSWNPFGENPDKGIRKIFKK